MEIPSPVKKEKSLDNKHESIKAQLKVSSSVLRRHGEEVEGVVGREGNK